MFGVKLRCLVLIVNMNVIISNGFITKPKRRFQGKKNFDCEKNFIFLRVNLRFENESEQEFNEKIANAEIYRQHSETFLKYNYLIDSLQTPTHHLNEEIKDRVLNFVLGHPFKLGPLRDPIEFLSVPAHIRFNSKYYLIPKLIDIPSKTIVERFKKKNYNIELLNSLVEEIGKEYIRANHQIEFDATLPYSGKI